MPITSNDSLFHEVKVSLESPLFYQRICNILGRAQSQGRELTLDNVFKEEFSDLTKLLDQTGIQESCSVRNILKTRCIATLLVDDNGEIKEEIISKLVKSFKQTLYSIGPERHLDATRDEHIVNVLELLQNRKDLIRFVKNMTRPVANKLAENIIRDTLLLPSTAVVTDAHVKRACLMAWFTTLRQSLGSCFATAPAILIHTEQPHLFLRDLDEIMNTGRMKRTYGGVEYSVPMSTTWGKGDLKKPIVLQHQLASDKHKIWRAPGLIAAFDAVSIFPKDMKDKEKAYFVRKILERNISKIKKHGVFFITNAEELIRIVLLDHHGITEEDVSDYINRPKSMMQSGLMLHVPRTSKKSSGKVDLVVTFLKDLEIAEKAFRALADCALLKAWEFTLASFAEVKTGFTRWNLYASLGINYDDPGGIGEHLHKIVSEKVEQAKIYLRERQDEYDSRVGEMRYLEQRMRQAGTEQEIQWLKIEYQSRQADLHHIEQLHKMAVDKANRIANLNQFLIDYYDQKFPDYFQEIYDAEIHDIAQGPFDDAPAGFRLLYKYGRTNPSQWVRIYTPSEFIESLVSFFTLTEQDMTNLTEAKGMEDEISFIVTQLVNHVRSEAFLETAFYRLAKARGVRVINKPLENLDKVDTKPWVYTSGGSMSTLVSAYFRRDEKPAEVDRWVENETELLAFLIDTIRQLPKPVLTSYIDNSEKSMLIHSPTHAFLLKPGFPILRDIVSADTYSYSWIKNNYIEPIKSFIKSMPINEMIARDFVMKLYQRIPFDFQQRFKQRFFDLAFRPTIYDFRNKLIEIVNSDSGLRTNHGPIFTAEDVDSLLFSCMPYTPRKDVKEKLKEILVKVFKQDKRRLEKLDALLDQYWKPFGENEFVASCDLANMAKALSAIILGSTRCSCDLNKAIINEMRNSKLAYPSSLIFADTNWVKDYFGFVVNPATEELEFWSCDYLATHGRPVNSWKMWLNGSKREPTWGVYNRPSEYVEDKKNGRY